MSFLPSKKKLKGMLFMISLIAVLRFHGSSISMISKEQERIVSELKVISELIPYGNHNDDYGFEKRSLGVLSAAARAYYLSLFHVAVQGSHKDLRTVENMSNHSRTSQCPAVTATLAHSTKPSLADLVSITLVTQTTMDRIWILRHTCQRWRNSPIVVAVSIPYTDQQGDENEQNNFLRDIREVKTQCPNVKLVGVFLDEVQSDTLRYPINQMRNIALDHVRTSHMIMIDIDFLPSQDLDDTIKHVILEGLVADPKWNITDKELHEEEQRQQLNNTNATTNNNNDTNSSDTDEVLETYNSSADDDVLQTQRRTAIVVPAFEYPSHCNNATDCTTIAEKIPKTFLTLRNCIAGRKCYIFKGKGTANGKGGHSSTDQRAWLHQRWYETVGTRSVIRRVKCFLTRYYEPYVALQWCPIVMHQHHQHPPLTPPPPQQRQTNLLNLSLPVTSDSDDKDLVPPTTTGVPLAPYYDERFYGYGLNKIEMTHKLRAMKYSFNVLPEGFLVHNPHPATILSQTFKAQGTESDLKAEMRSVEQKLNKYLKTMYTDFNVRPNCETARAASHPRRRRTLPKSRADRARGKTEPGIRRKLEIERDAIDQRRRPTLSELRARFANRIQEDRLATQGRRTTYTIPRKVGARRRPETRLLRRTPNQ